MQAQLIVSVFLNQTSQRDKAVEREREITYRRRRGVGAAAVERVVSNQREITRVRERKEITHSYFFSKQKKNRNWAEPGQLSRLAGNFLFLPPTTFF
jgi:hypothetical protein